MEEILAKNNAWGIWCKLTEALVEEQRGYKTACGHREASKSVILGFLGDSQSGG